MTSENTKFNQITTKFAWRQILQVQGQKDVHYYSNTDLCDFRSVKTKLGSEWILKNANYKSCSIFCNTVDKDAKKSVGRLCLSDLVRSTGRFLIAKPQIRIVVRTWFKPPWQFLVRTRFLSHRDNSTFLHVYISTILQTRIVRTRFLSHRDNSSFQQLDLEPPLAASLP